MSIASAAPIPINRAARSAISAEARTRRMAVRLLAFYAFVMLAIPSNIAIGALGGASYPAGLIGLALLLIWGLGTLFGLHDPRRLGTPVRWAIVLLWIASLTSFTFMDRSALDYHEIQGANRYLLELAIMSGVAFLAAEGLRSLDDVRRVLRAGLWGASFCGLVAALQFWAHIDITSFLRGMLPGFSVIANTGEDVATRDGLNRVAGTASYPIELGVVSAVILPLAVWMAIHDDQRRSAFMRWTPVVLILVSSFASVSRSSVITLGIVAAVLIVALPPRQRVVALLAVPVAFAGVLLSAHGLISTLTGLLTVGSHDPSISHRENTYGYVQQLVSHAPWLGQGVGTYIANTNAQILDNEYLKTLIESGIIGEAALIGLFLTVIVTPLIARRQVKDPALRLFCAAVAAGGMAAAAGSAMFDSFSFNMFYATLAFLLGMAGVAWRLAYDEVSASSRPAIVTSNRSLRSTGDL